ncbi:hypothetical protein DVH24_000152 [Malus domestica]|uniref:Uncharacterized protein n=1 Tax=Malus domestica TaxID=3750 RepID=A0A498J3Y0_MALDO|nr:hypothetical protein DVH24_000152 [Malus domestica]
MKANERDLKTLSFNDKNKIKGKYRELFVKVPFVKRKTNENCLKTLSFNNKDKIKVKMNSTKIDFLV